MSYWGTASNVYINTWFIYCLYYALYSGIFTGDDRVRLLFYREAVRNCCAAFDLL